MPKKSLPLDIEMLKELFSYDAETGVITRIKVLPRSGCAVGDPAGIVDMQGYVSIKMRGKVLLGHRVAWALHHGEQPPAYLDHKNCVKSDNRIDNLRPADLAQNQGNIVPYTNHKGASFHNGQGKWFARIKKGNKLHHLGSFVRKEDAMAAYQEAAKAYFGDYARFA